MPEPSPYHLRILAARRALDAGPRADVLRALAEFYADAIARVAAQVGSGTIDSDRAAALSRSLRKALARLASRLATALDDEAARAIELAAEGAWEATEALVGDARPSWLARSTFDAVPEVAVEALFVRRGLPSRTTYRALSRRMAGRIAPQFEDAIARAVAAGSTGEDLTRSLASALAEVDPLVKRAAERAGQGRLLKRQLLASARLDPDPDVLVAARRLWYEARRIAITEINVAHAEGARVAAERSPVVDLLRWRVSGRHDGLPSSPDVCDYYRFADAHGYGAGLYHPAAFPALPHPHCACHGAHVLRPASEWGKPARPLPGGVQRAGPAARERSEAAVGRAVSDARWARAETDGHARARLALKLTSGA